MLSKQLVFKLSSSARRCVWVGGCWFAFVSGSVSEPLFLSRAQAQPLIPLEDSSWVDEVVWRERTDGTPSLVVERVLPGGPMAGADLRRGDRVVSYAGVFPENAIELRELAVQMRDAEASLTLLRGDRIVVIGMQGNGIAPPRTGPDGSEEIGVGRPGRIGPGGVREGEGLILRPGNSNSLGLNQPAVNPSSSLGGERIIESSSAAEAFGFLMSDFRSENYPGYDTPVTTGVMVEQVVTDSLAHRSGISAGMIIVAVDGRRVDTAAEVERWLIERANRTEVSVLAYDSRTLKRIRMPLDRPVENTEEVAAPQESGESMLENIGGLLPLVGPGESQELIDLDQSESLEALPAPEPVAESIEPQSDGVTIEPIAPQQPPSDETSSRRGILGGIMRRDGEEEASERVSPLEQRARDVAIDSLKRRIERQQRLLEQQMQELKSLQEELAKLEANRQ